MTEELTLSVSTNGDDAWSGRLAEPNTDCTDGPFASVERARDAVRELKRQQGGALWQPVTVCVSGGTLFLNQPLQLTHEDSGTAECPVTYAGHGGETPVLSGGKLVTGWKGVTINGKQAWVADVSHLLAGDGFFHQLWVNGDRRRRSRYPKKGYLPIAHVPDATPEGEWFRGQTGFRFQTGDLMAWDHLTDGEVVVMTRWAESRLPIVAIDEQESLVSCSKRSIFKLDPGDLYYVENILDLLEDPGEWCLDREAGMLYYLPLPGEDPRTSETIVPSFTQVMKLKGDVDEGHFVEHIHFRGIAFSHTEWYFPKGLEIEWPSDDVGGFPQAVIGVPGAILGEGVRNCCFEGCIFAHVGTYALELSQGCRNNRITRCDFHDLGAGGIKIGEPRLRPGGPDTVTETPDHDKELQTLESVLGPITPQPWHTSGNEITDCRIHDGGVFFHSAVGVWIGQSYDNSLIHNDIYDFYYTGISIGWTWGYGPALARGNVVEFNHVHHIGVLSDGDGPILSDMGGIYTLGVQPGTVIRNNIFHDISGVRYGGWGIYFDEGSTHIIAENNLVYRTRHGGFHQHYGRENTVRNNIFAFGRDMQITRSRPEDHESIRFENNIVLWREGLLLSGNVAHLHFTFDRNLYWNENGGEITFGEFTWDQWRELGMDKSSLVADPLFVDPDNGDFRLQSDSPALLLGFVPPDFSCVGPRQ